MAQVPGGPVNQVVLLNSIWIGPRAQVANVSPRPFQRDCSWVTKSWPARWCGINISIYSHEFNKKPLSNGSTNVPWKSMLRGLEADAEGSTKMSELGGSQMVRGTQAPGFRGFFLGKHMVFLFPKMEVMEELAGILEIYLTRSLRKCHCYQWHNFLKAFGKQSNPMLKAYAASSPGSARRWSTPFAWFLQRRLCGSQNWLGDIGTPSSNMHQRIRRLSWMGIATKA